MGKVMVETSPPTNIPAFRARLIAYATWLYPRFLLSLYLVESPVTAKLCKMAIWLALQPDPRRLVVC
jgi:hypothetical protein